MRDQDLAALKAANDAFLAAVPKVCEAFMATREARAISGGLDVFTPGWRRG